MKMKSNMDKIKLLVLGLMFFASNLFAQSLSVEPNYTVMYYQMPTSIKVNHTSVGTWHWSVGIALNGVDFGQDTLLSGWGQVYNQDFVWKPNCVTDSGRFIIRSTFGDSAISFLFKIKYGTVDFPNANDTAWWGTTTVYNYEGHNLPKYIVIKYKWNDGEYKSLGAHSDVGKFTFAMNDEKWSDTIKTMKFGFFYEDGTLIKESDVIVVKLDYIGLRNKLRYQSELIDSLKGYIANDTACANLVDSLKDVIVLKNKRIGQLERLLEDSSKIYLVYKVGDIVTVEYEQPTYLAYTVSLRNDTWIYFAEVMNNATYQIFDYSGKYVEGHHMNGFYKVDVGHLSSGVYFFALKREDGTHLIFKFNR